MKSGNLSLKDYLGYIIIKRLIEFFSISAIISIWYLFYSTYNKIESSIFYYLIYGIFVSPFIFIFTGYIIYSFLIELISFIINAEDSLILIFISPTVFCSEAIYYYFARLDSGPTKFVGYMESVAVVFVVYVGIGYYVLKNFIRD